MKVPFNREKYINILHSDGISSALTVLHLDIERWENQTFEGSDGYQPEMFEDLLKVRDFSRELWRMALEDKSLS